MFLIIDQFHCICLFYHFFLFFFGDNFIINFESFCSILQFLSSKSKFQKRMKFIQKPLDGLLELFQELQFNSTSEIMQSCITLSSAVPRKSYSNVNVILSVGGCSKSRILKQTYCYIPGRDRWTCLGELNAPRWR